HGVHLEDELDVDTLLFAHGDQAVEDGLPVFVAGEVVVGDEEAVDALGQVLADDELDVIGGTAAALTALHVDDGAEGALEGAAAAGVEAGHVATGAADAGGVEERDGGAFESGKVVHEIVDGFELSGPAVAEDFVEA